MAKSTTTKELDFIFDDTKSSTTKPKQLHHYYKERSSKIINTDKKSRLASPIRGLLK